MSPGCRRDEPGFGRDPDSARARMISSITKRGWDANGSLRARLASTRLASRSSTSTSDDDLSDNRCRVACTTARRGQPKPADEHADDIQDVPFGVPKQGKTPADGIPDRQEPLHDIAGREERHRQSLPDAAMFLGGGEDTDLGRRPFDGQGEPFESPSDRGHDWGYVTCHLEGGDDCPRPVDEQRVTISPSCASPMAGATASVTRSDSLTPASGTDATPWAKRASRPAILLGGLCEHMVPGSGESINSGKAPMVPIPTRRQRAHQGAVTGN